MVHNELFEQTADASVVTSHDSVEQFPALHQKVSFDKQLTSSALSTYYWHFHTLQCCAQSETVIKPHVKQKQMNEGLKRKLDSDISISVES